MNLLLLLLLLLEGRYLDAAFDLAGPYSMKFTHVEYCNDGEPETFNYTLKFTKKSKTKMVWNTPYNIIEDMDDDVWVKFTAAKWGSGGWGENALVQEMKPFCSQLKEIAPRIFKVYTDSLGVANECPIPKGSYMLNDFPTDMETLENFPVLPYGKYKMKNEYMKGDERFSCMTIIAEITEEAAGK